jgi:hypothetical protein
MSEILVNRLKFEDNTPMGAVIQFEYQEINTQTATTSIIPADNTIPQSSEGLQLFSVTITPKKIGNVLKVYGSFYIQMTANGLAAFSLFKDSNASAETAVSHVVNASNSTVHLTHIETVISLDAIEFKIRGGITGAGPTLRVSPDTFGGKSKSYLIIEEIQAE